MAERLEGERKSCENLFGVECGGIPFSTDRPRVLVITGISGSGKTTALKTLEDFGYEVIDNIPVSLCSDLICQKEMARSVAIGIDLRTRDFDPGFVLSEFAKIDCADVEIVFFEASEEVIRQRYRETRRIHPLGASGNLGERMKKEIDMLSIVKKSANWIIDTSAMSTPELRKVLKEKLCIKSDLTTIYVMSFSFKFGVPSHSDMVFDMRFLPNPYYKKEMRFLTGKAISIKGYLHSEPIFAKFLDSLRGMLLDIVLPKLSGDGRREIILAFGCTGGKHRSVFTAEEVYEMLRSNGYRVKLHHREL
ncbi:RNase adapter RapZ [Candidatus Hydrogenosomobacter endosymbioticus]|uniref:Nucleotide-binding protein n=1 Tax=Candidatus Hydrogenosomobacter endosymbioticus TaxID=2558174 RepID=A0ABN6L2U3_9PROT|nr:RNase adapter RapZ [Candidatus Hydrogenosomobacter endosymbioticus]BDB96214.1 nucleotide-binding protein [Candidatus Hydrogenosomobacter endosymbioticus]